MRIALIETADPGSAGSMTRYASLVEFVLRDVPGVECQRVSLASPSNQLSRIPRRLRTAAHHATIFWRAGRVANQVPADIYHVIDGSHGYVTARLPRGKTVVTSHDIIPELQARGHFSIAPPGRFSRCTSHFFRMARMSTIPADSLPFGPKKSTHCHRPLCLLDSRFRCAFASVVAALAVSMAFVWALFFSVGSGFTISFYFPSDC